MTEAIRIRSGAAELAVTVQGTGAPLLALHPGVADRRTWQFVAPSWVDAGHRVIAHGRRGFGETTYEPERHDPLADVLAVLDALADAPAVVLGNSMGASLALELAVAHPDRMSALVLIGATVSGYPGEWVESDAEQRMDAVLAAAEESGDLARVNEVEAHYWLDGTDQPEGRVTREARELFLQMNGRALSQPDPGEVIARPPVWDSLAGLRMPTLLVTGEHDLPMFQTIGAAAADQISGGRHVHLSGTAHCPQLDAPGALDDVVVPFLQQA